MTNPYTEKVFSKEEVEKLIFFIFSSRKEYSKKEIKKFESTIKEMNERLNFHEKNNDVPEDELKDIRSVLEGKLKFE